MGKVLPLEKSCLILSQIYSGVMAVLIKYL